MPQPDFVNAQLIVSVVVILVVIHVILASVTFLIYVERKIAAYVSDRIGPNRTGFDFGLPALKPLKGVLGLGQSLADGLKFILKEDYSAKAVDKLLFTLAPAAIIVPALIGFAIIPWGGTWEVSGFTIPLLGWVIEPARVQVVGAPVNAGIIYLLAVASIGIYGVVLGGWASNNKYSFLGSMRAAAQMISYEIPLGLSLLAVLLMAGSLLPWDIVNYQVHNGWLLFSQPVAAIIFLIAILAEANRLPFDNAESESDLVGGYHTEYSAMRFALFFLAEYAHMITSSAFFVLLFMGGWDPIPLFGHGSITPVDPAGAMGFLIVLVKVLIYFGKVGTLVVFFMFVRWTLPRLRYDQVMQMAWQAVIPISLVVVVMTAVMVHVGLDQWILPGWSVMLLVNAVLVAVLLGMQPLLPRGKMNRKVPLAGSRFSPLAGQRVQTGPPRGVARDDRPVEGTAPVAM